MIDAGSDEGIAAESFSLEGLFSEMALAVCSMVADLDRVEASEIETVELWSHSTEGLLVAWLNELVFLFDTRGFVPSKVEITSLDPEAHRLVAILGGENLEGDRLGQGILIKAATYHGLKIDKKDGQWSAEVMLDL